MSERLILGLGLPLVIGVIAVVAIAGAELQRGWNLRKREKMK